MRYKKIDDIPVLVLTASVKNGRAITEPCPFCGEHHIHSPEPGHRAPHCEGSAILFAVCDDGTLVSRDDGYILHLEKKRKKRKVTDAKKRPEKLWKNRNQKQRTNENLKN